MTKCGKGCMPECEYFTTGGCISPFNCQYKIETGYINSATSIPTYIPTYMEKQMSMTAEEIERCLERFTLGKTTDVMNFDYAGTLAYIQQLKSENAALRERLEKTEHRAKGAERALKKFAENISCEDCPFFFFFSSSEKMKDSVHPNYCFDEYLRQAEKELA